MGNPKGFLITGRETAPDRDALERLKDFDEIPTSMGDEKIKSQSGRCMDCGVPFCMSGCPLGNFIPDFNDLAYRGQWEEAVRTLYATNNFPEITGRICPAPCESSCVLGITDPPVTIKQMEKAIVEKAFEWQLDVAPPQAVRSGKRVAIVGAGPAGLACAQQLGRAGHRVVVFEKAPEAGGLLTWGIPAYKLPKDIVQRRVKQLQDEGIKFFFNTTVGETISWQSIKDEHHALVLCIGAEVPRDLDIEGRSAKGIYFAMDFLHQQSAKIMGLPRWNYHEDISAKDKHVIVIGGGDTGSDCIGTSLRQGARSVVNFELLPKPQSVRDSASNPWPQYDRSYRMSSSVEENLAHGGRTEFSILSQAFEVGKDGLVTGVHTSRVEWRAEKKGQRPEMRVLENSRQFWQGDLILLAMGYLGPKASTLTDELGLELDARSNIIGDPNIGVFSAGDCRRGQSLVVWAIAEGREIAARVDEFLNKNPTKLSRCRLTPYKY